MNACNLKTGFVSIVNSFERRDGARSIGWPTLSQLTCAAPETPLDLRRSLSNFAAINLRLKPKRLLGHSGKRWLALLFALCAAAALAGPVAAQTAPVDRHDRFYWLGEQNKASVAMLAERGIITRDLAAQIAKSIKQVIADAAKPGAPRSGDYLEVEKSMIAVGGPEVTRIHSGRSRQDMGQTSFRLILREELLSAYERFIEAREALLKLAESHPNAILPFNTHAVQAQPTSLGHYLGGYLEALSRESDRYRETWARLNLSPLGGAAGGTSSFPIDRQRLAELLGFDGVLVNSFDSGQVANLDLGVDVSSLAASGALTVGMLTSDILTQYPNPRPWFQLAEGEQTGISSIMPQKRNPLGLENVLRATGEVSGKAVTYLIESQNFPSGSGVYKGATPIEVTRASGEMYQATADVLGALVFYPDRALERVNEDYGATTELADELQRDENVPFRVGHHFASELVTFGRANNLKPAQLPYAEAQRIYAKAASDFHLSQTELPLSETQFRRALTAENMVQAAEPLGGPQPAEVERMLAAERQRLTDDRAWLAATRSKLEEAAQERDAALANLMR